MDKKFYMTNVLLYLVIWMKDGDVCKIRRWHFYNRPQRRDWKETVLILTFMFYLSPGFYLPSRVLVWDSLQKLYF